ncbi:hypothetical protein OCK74_11215 [Chitinophagaceae bacterium LB-8]|uniref:Uncharacterized protein n=1 Tax=Paraflavisolibacter caeni TaxID=2982496 RepID=A0A9X2XW22_9BACT|nr:hypothetical protein [Paraflavisolibacter caeni]MCU7549687.1 hypothetical protein [Paraflavisolibacter caeni]
MKPFSTAILLLILPFFAITQGTAVGPFAGQLKKILTEASSGFKSFRKEKVEQVGSDVVYASKVNLQGTTENKINSYSDGISYMATIASGIDEKQAKSLVENWKKKLLSILGKGYEEVPYRNNNNKTLQEGYFLIGEQLTVSIDYSNYEPEQPFNVYLVVLKQ